MGRRKGGTNSDKKGTSKSKSEVSRSRVKKLMRAMTLKNVCSALALAGVAAIIAVAVFAEEGEAAKFGYDPDHKEGHRAHLERFYLEHNPSKLGRAHDGHLDRVLEKYAGKEAELFNVLKDKYDVCPFFDHDNSCRNRAGDAQCDGMARRGECFEQAMKQHAWMVENCAKSCGTCKLRRASVRCHPKTSPLKWSRKNAIKG